MSITFEKLPGPIYSAYLRVGDYSIALEPELIESLKAIMSEENDQFLHLMVDQIGINRYLRNMIQKKIAEEENQAALILRLRKALDTL